MRPRGEIRAALSTAAQALAKEARAGFTYMDLAVHGRVGYDAARSATKDMVKAGELRPVGTRQVPGKKRPLRTYVPGHSEAAHRTDASQALAGAMRNWATSF